MSLTAVLASEAAIKNSCVQVASDHEVSVRGGVEGVRRPCGDASTGACDAESTENSGCPTGSVH